MTASDPKLTANPLRNLACSTRGDFSDPAGLFRGRRILLVEDEPMISLVLTDWLEDEGACVVGPAATIEEARALAGAETLDGAVLDVNLGGTAVYCVADVLCSRNVAVVLTTGYNIADLPERFAAVPALQKPFLLQNLGVTLAGALDRAHRS